MSLSELLYRLRVAFETTEAIDVWLNTKNPYLGHETPKSLLAGREHDRIARALEAQLGGVYT